MKELFKDKGLLGGEKNFVAHSGEPDFFSLPLSDFDIIKFQNLLVTPSVHFIQTKNISSGRSLMNTFLLPLKHYYNIACLTMIDNETLFHTVFDIVQMRPMARSLPDAIELFCIENPYIDFVWIESTIALQKEFPKSQMTNIYKLLSCNAQTPVLVIEYLNA